MEDISKDDLFNLIDFMNEENDFSGFNLEIDCNMLQKSFYIFTSILPEGEVLFTNYMGEYKIKNIIGCDKLKNEIEILSEGRNFRGINIYPSSPMYQKWKITSSCKPVRVK